MAKEEEEGTKDMLKEAVWAAWKRDLKAGTRAGNSGVHTFSVYGFTGIFAGLDNSMSAAQMREALEELR
jgi:hypothetical protein